MPPGPDRMSILAGRRYWEFEYACETTGPSWLIYLAFMLLLGLDDTVAPAHVPLKHTQALT
jgi:hypothetical protein